MKYVYIIIFIIFSGVSTTVYFYTGINPQEKKVILEGVTPTGIAGTYSSSVGTLILTSKENFDFTRVYDDGSSDQMSGKYYIHSYSLPGEVSTNGLVREVTIGSDSYVNKLGEKVSVRWTKNFKISVGTHGALSLCRNFMSGQRLGGAGLDEHCFSR